MFSVYHFCCVDWENIYNLSYFHHQIGSMNYYPLFRVKSWNNGVRCMSFYIFILVLIDIDFPPIIFEISSGFRAWVTIPWIWLVFPIIVKIKVVNVIFVSFYYANENFARINRPWPKCGQFRKWSGYISMLNLKPFRQRILKKCIETYWEGWTNLSGRTDGRAGGRAKGQWPG